MLLQQFKNQVDGGAAAWREPFQILTTLLLSLLIPLSFLLLARLSTAHYLASMLPHVHNSTSQLIQSFPFLYCISVILYTLVTLISIGAFVHALTGRIMLLRRESGVLRRPRLYAAWVFLCSLQVCVGLGIEGSIHAGIDGSGLTRETSLLCRTMLLVGLYETTEFWSKRVVKPVVEDTVMGFATEERWIERVGMGMSFGAVWWWGLRDEVDSLVLVGELMKREVEVAVVGVRVGVAEFVGWWLYYLTVSIGIIRVFKFGINKVGSIKTKLQYSRKLERDITTSDSVVSDGTIDHKV